MRIDALTTRIWRHGVGFAIAFDAVQLVVRTRMRASLSIAPLPVPAVFRELALSTPGLLAVAGAAVTAAFLFARGRRPLVTGVVALAAVRVLLEAFGALDGIYDETSYHAASAMLGWLTGLAFARVLGEGQGASKGVEGQGSSRWAGEAETLAALGAAAMFGATYLNAGVSKLRNSGITWADADTIRLLVIAHRPLGVTSWLDAVRTFAGQNATAALGLSIGTLVIQCGAFLFPWTRRTRLVWGSLFILFHVGIHLVAGSIFFLQAVFLAALFSYPWTRLAGRAVPVASAGSGEPSDSGSPEPALARSQSRRALFTGGAVVAGLLVIWIAPVRPRAHPVERFVASAPVAVSAAPVVVPMVSAFGPLKTGSDVAEGWVLRQIAVEPERVVLTLARADQEVAFELSPAGDAPKGRVNTGSLHLSYRTTSVPPDSFAKAEESLARALLDAAAGRDPTVAFREWAGAARP